MGGVLRSLRTYRRRAHLASLTSFMAEAAPGARLVFDVGAHVGDRVTAFRRVNARVVAVEPQPMLAAVLRAMFAFDRDVTVLRHALGAESGRGALKVNTSNPTVSTLSDGFVTAAKDQPGWEGQTWDAALSVDVTTLDALIAAHGLPDFIKIDTEGHEHEVLAGLTAPVPALSFEITMIAREAGLKALVETGRLGFTHYRLSLGESHAWSSGWMDAAGMAGTIRNLPDSANSGDIYARR